MFIPIYDENPLRHVLRPYVTWGLLAVTCLCFALSSLPSLVPDERVLDATLGMVPSLVDGTRTISPESFHIPAPLTALTYLFLHANLLHLGGNMLFLWVFGDNVEDALGHGRFLAFYLLAGIFAALVHAAAYPLSDSPLVGASGAVAGLVGGYLLLHPRVRLWILAFGRIPLPVPAWAALGAWGLFQVYNVIVQTDDGIGWVAHLGGFVAGMVLVVIMRRPGVPLFDHGTPDA